MNISTLLEHFHDPETLDPGVRQRIEAACQRGGTSLCSTGTSPGFVTESLPVALTSLQRRLDCLTIREYANIAERNSPGMISMLFGGEPAAVDASGIAQGAGAHYGGSLRRLAKALSLRLDEVTATAEVAVAKAPVTTAAGIIEAGTVAAWRIEMTGIRRRRTRATDDPPVVHHGRPRAGLDIPFPGQGWRVVVDGDSPLDVTIRFTWPTEEERTLVGYGNAARPVNALPYVCAARPGIVTSFDLPQIAANLG